MKISNLIIPIYSLTILFIVAVLHKLKVGDFVQQIQYTEFAVDFINILLSLIIFVQIRNFAQKNFIFLSISIIALFLMDISYEITFFVNFQAFSVFEFFNFAWYITAITSFILLLSIYIYDKKEIKLILFTFIVITLIIIIFFAPTFLKYLSFPYYSIDLTATITLFYLSMLVIITIKNRYILFGFSGFCFGMIGNFIMTEYYLNNTPNNLVLIYGEIMWLTTTLLISFSMINIIKFKFHNPNDWFFNSKSIRNKQAFIIFHVSILGYILACIAIKEFKIIVEDNFVFIPAFGMLYAMAAAILSVVLSKQSEKPFILLQNEIQSLFDGKKYTIKNFNILEFQELNKFIVEYYNYKTSLEKHIISMATRIAHDIKSPLQIIENLIKNQDNDSNHSSQEQFLKQINKINYISKSLLNENKKIIGSDSYGFQSLYCIVEDLIADKQIEWNTENSIIDFEYKPNQIIWLNNEQSKIKNTISNLLNNAFEASNSNSNNIKLRVDLENNNIIINIQDFGCGIHKKDLNDIINGKSLKINGNGIGLSTAQKFMLYINGTLTINSDDSEINHGTAIKLEFPNLTFPEQFATKINITTKNIIIVDDDSNVVNFWQEYLLCNLKNNDVMYFLNFSSLKNHLSKKSNSSEVTYLLDYSILGERLTGIDIIKQFNLKNVYLITNYAEDIKLQDEIKPLTLKLVPKTMLQIMRKNKAIL